MVTVAKFNDKLVEIVRIADRVGFSEDRGWICVCFDFHEPERKKDHFKWVPVTTRFEWVREFNFG
jgi:hypothetical protein